MRMRAPSVTSFGFLVLLQAAALSCAADKPAKPTQIRAERAAPPAARSTPAAPVLADRGWSIRALPRLALSVSLPEAARWRELPGGRWARLEHAASHSLLELSQSRARRLATPEECAQKAYLERPDLPRPAASEALDHRRVTLPHDVLADVTVSLENASADEIVGHVTLFGASVGRCVSAHFSTRVGGADRDQEVARRLRMAVDGIVPSIEQLVADQRVQPEPLER
jgi:hypothetical protein